MMNLLQTLNLLTLPVGIVWALFGRARDLRINGVLVPPFLQACLRLVAPFMLMAVLIMTPRPAVYDRP